MDEYQKRKRERKVESNYNFATVLFHEIFKDIPIDRETMDFLLEGLYQTVDAATDLNCVDSMRVFEVRFPSLWFEIEYEGSKFIIVTYALRKTMYELGLIYGQQDNLKCMNGTKDEVVSRIRDVASGKQFPQDESFIITPYTKFLSTLDAKAGLAYYKESLKNLNIMDIDEFVMSLDAPKEQIKTLTEFIRFLWERLYFTIMHSFKKSSNGWTFSFKDDDDMCAITFDALNPGESGTRCVTLAYKDSEMVTRTIDSRRELECFINERTGISYKNPNK